MGMNTDAVIAPNPDFVINPVLAGFLIQDAQDLLPSPWEEFTASRRSIDWYQVAFN